jgi:hypothetical protein
MTMLTVRGTELEKTKTKQNKPQTKKPKQSHTHK